MIDHKAKGAVALQQSRSIMTGPTTSPGTDTEQIISSKNRACYAQSPPQFPKSDLLSLSQVCSNKIAKISITYSLYYRSLIFSRRNAKKIGKRNNRLGKTEKLRCAACFKTYRKVEVANWESLTHSVCSYQTLCLAISVSRTISPSPA